MSDMIDKTESLLTYLICGDATGRDNVDAGGRRKFDTGMEFAETDAGSLLQFSPMRPRLSYTVQSIDSDVDDSSDRIFTTDAGLLLAPVQDILGKEAEIAFIADDRVKWTGFRKINKPPRGVWVASPGASIYELHYREIFENGSSTYFKRVAAVSKRGQSVPCLVEGSTGAGAGEEGRQAILAASIIEDAHRIDVLTATISDSTAVVVPVPIGDHKELFALRDAPMTPAGRRRAILHWVAEHSRRKKTGEPFQVKRHTRGVRELTIDGLTVRLEPNDTKDKH
jgi:hypothetical protein